MTSHASMHSPARVGGCHPWDGARWEIPHGSTSRVEARPTSACARVLEWTRLLEIRRVPEILDVVSSFDSLAVHFDPSDGEKVLAWLLQLPIPSHETSEIPGGPRVDIPVVYGGESGPDLERLAVDLGRTGDEIVKLHSSADYRVAAVGFSPGFPYLLGLPDELHVPRRSSPRKVPAGSVAIAGTQAGIYPFESQGGWHVLGRTAVPMFHLGRWSPALLRPGDRVRFVPVDEPGDPGEFAEIPLPPSEGSLEIIEPGAFSTIQDLGRPGHQALGVSPGGAADPLAARVANRLVGNPDDAALIECTMMGPLLHFHRALRVSIVGWADGRSGKCLNMNAGDRLDLRGRMRSLRGYVGIAGGINVPRVLGSRATDVRAGFGGWHGRVLREGDRLPIGPARPGHEPGNWRVGWPRDNPPGRPVELRFLRGMQAGWFPESTQAAFPAGTYQISPDSDRMGARLDGPPLFREDAREMVSQPVVAGSVQVPPDGQPIVLLAERQTIGGYPQIGHVISADLPKLARAWPGTKLRFREVSIAEARAAWDELQRELRYLQAGLDFLP